MEEFRKINNYDNYEVSNLGNIRNLVTSKVLRQSLNKNGYYFVTLYKESRPKKYLIHRLVAIAFLENPENKNIVDHIDTNRSNNNLTNLRWATSSQNSSNKTVTNYKWGYRGILYIDLYKEWVASITYNKEIIKLGYFNSQEEALIARLKAVYKYFGEYAYATEKQLIIEKGIEDLIFKDICDEKNKKILLDDIQEIYNDVLSYQLNHQLKSNLSQYKLYLLNNMKL